MPVAARDMNGYRDFERGHLRTSSYSNGYDPYRRDREDYSPRRSMYAADLPTLPTNRSEVLPTARSEFFPSGQSDVFSSKSYRDRDRGRHNGIEDYEQNSYDGGMRDGGMEMSFVVDHLATYTSKSGTTRPEDGLTKLRQMESSTGIWTMRCTMILEKNHIVVVDKGNGEELERFPLNQVYDPTAVFKNDKKETYNNLILFTVVEDPHNRKCPSDMHIFQSVTAKANFVVDEILAAKGDSGGPRRGGFEQRIPPPPSGPAPEPPYAGRFGASGAGGNRASFFHHTELDSGQNEALEKDVQLLNNCFDDIEKFVSRLQQAAEAYKELERRRVERGNKRRNKIAGDGMLTMRARPPPGEDFVDIFQKFKFAFNLLAKLKAHIHDPNAPELVHFLFTPLSLIYEASRDPIHNNRDLSGEAVAPLLMFEAKQLLLNCLTSKELELWQRLGKPWTLIKDEWHGHVPTYSPRFYNGWQPSLHADENGPSMGRLIETYRDRDDYRRDDAPYRDFRATERPTDYRPIERDDFRNTRRDEMYTQEIRPRDDLYGRDTRNDYRSPSPPAVRTTYSENKRTANTSIENLGSRSRADENLAFAQELKRMGATIYEAVHDRQSKHAKELTVEKGDIFQVLDNSRNWWKLKNNRGDVGHAPYTILKEYQPRDEYNNGQGRRLSGDYSSYINGQAPPAPPPPGSNRGGRGDARRDDKPPPQAPPIRPKQENVLDFRREDKHPQQPPPVRSKQDREYRGSKYSDDLHTELRLRMNTSGDSSGSPRSPGGTRPPVNISQYSSADEVVDWLESKGFSQRCVHLLRGYNGADVFGLHREEYERLLGKDEGRHLDSLLMVQKNNSGYRQRGTSELKAILEKRKERMADDERFGSRPSFMPETPPDYSPPPSEASSDDFGDAGKTLRHLLERQRKKIQTSSDDFGDAGKTLRHLLERQRKKIQSNYYQQYD